VFEILQQLTGRRPPPRIPFPVADLLGAAEELRVNLFGGTPLLTRGAVDIFRHDWSLDSGEAIRELGYTLTPLTEGVARTLSSIRGGASPVAPARSCPSHRGLTPKPRASGSMSDRAPSRCCCAC
jgi:hypothetical protein